jgi:hypothetical protein
VQSHRRRIPYVLYACASSRTSCTANSFEAFATDADNGDAPNPVLRPLLQSVKGVGPRLAEAVVLHLDDPHRFKTGEQVAGAKRGGLKGVGRGLKGVEG